MSKTDTKTAPDKPKGRRVKHSDDLVITMLVEENPKRKGSRARGEFAFYKNGMTVAEYLKAGGSRASLIWDENHKFIRLGEAKAKAA